MYLPGRAPSPDSAEQESEADDEKLPSSSNSSLHGQDPAITNFMSMLWNYNATAVAAAAAGHPFPLPMPNPGNPLFAFNQFANSHSEDVSQTSPVSDSQHSMRGHHPLLLDGSSSEQDTPRKRSLVEDSDSSSKRAKLAGGSGGARLARDEPVPSGYVKYRFNENCGYAACSYREHQTHFHCMRDSCGYSFCDKTRFVQHTARHERLGKWNLENVDLRN